MSALDCSSRSQGVRVHQQAMLNSIVKLTGRRELRHRCKNCHTTAALPGLRELGRFLGAGKQQQQQQQQARNRFAQASQQLLDLLTDSSRSTTGEARRGRKSAGQGEKQRETENLTDKLLDTLLACEGLQFKEQLLGGGPWLVVYTRGSLQLWKATYQAGKTFSPRNAASQDLDPNSRAVINKAEYAGQRVYVTASGTYEPLDSNNTLPKLIQANICSGMLHVFGLDIPLPIKGTGQFEVVYLDDQLRVFRSGGAISVQVKQQYLQDQGLI